jgi:hypothetical protein
LTTERLAKRPFGRYSQTCLVGRFSIGITDNLQHLSLAWFAYHSGLPGAVRSHCAEGSTGSSDCVLGTNGAFFQWRKQKAFEVSLLEFSADQRRFNREYSVVYNSDSLIYHSIIGYLASESTEGGGVMKSCFVVGICSRLLQVFTGQLKPLVCLWWR